MQEVLRAASCISKAVNKCDDVCGKLKPGACNANAPAWCLLVSHAPFTACYDMLLLQWRYHVGATEGEILLLLLLRITPHAGRCVCECTI